MLLFSEVHPVLGERLECAILSILSLNCSVTHHADICTPSLGIPTMEFVISGRLLP